MIGPCAKTTVRCTLVTATGEHVVGTNYCENPRATCPRAPGEGYEKCVSVCRQAGHAEAVAVRLAGDRARGARAYLEGHTYACMDCQHALFGAGVISLSIGAPPEAAPASWGRRLLARAMRPGTLGAANIPGRVPRSGQWPDPSPQPEITLDERAERYRRGKAVYEFLSDAARLQLAIDGDILRAASERRMR